LTAVVGKGWVKGKSAIPVRGPSVAMVRTREGETELAMGGEGGGRRSRMGDGVGRTRQRVWDRGARDARRLG
jgi:hypothetical protein